MTEKLLVTGASGFIGTHCILELLNNGYQVVGTVRDMDRTDQIVSILEKHTKNIKISYVKYRIPYLMGISSKKLVKFFIVLKIRGYFLPFIKSPFHFMFTVDINLHHIATLFQMRNV